MEKDTFINRYDFKESIIVEYQKRLQDFLIIEDGGLTVYTRQDNKSLSSGCKACKSGEWTCIYVGWQCNATCDFCPQFKTNNIDYTQMFRDKWIDDYKVYVDSFAGTYIKGISYSGGEPFLYIDKMLPFMKFVSSKGNIYQWIYTNGIIVEYDAMKKVSDAGVNEIRFNLAASHFSPIIIRKVEEAHKYFEFVAVEVPSIPLTYKFLIEKNGISTLNNIGIDQLNLAEMQIRGPNESHYSNTPKYVFSNEFVCITSPLYSRKNVYKIIEAAISKRISYIINDCSNEAKFRQQLMKSLNPLQRHIW